MSPEPSSVFDRGEIFKNRELLKVGHVPDLTRVIGRDEEVEAVGEALAPATIGGPPEAITIFGKTGTGKSLVARSTTQALYNQVREDVNLQHSYVDCSDYQSEAQASREMARGLRKGLDIEKSIPSTGIAASNYRDMAWQMLNDNDVDSFIVILDEIDMLENDNLLRSLSRARESGKADSHIGVISISNKVQYRNELSERVDSSLQDNVQVFHPYDADQLTDILEARKDAFREGVLENGVIEKTAALAAKEHGDARRAVTILYEAGRLAQTEDSETVSVEHVDAAKTQAEKNRFKELISGTTPHVKKALHALASLTVENDRDSFRTQQVYGMYKELCEDTDTDPLSEDRVRRLLKEQGFLGITESSHTGGGGYEGSYLVHKLMEKPQVVIDVVAGE